MLQDYISNGSPLRTIKSEKQIVKRDEQDSGTYRIFLASELPAGHMTPTPVVPCGFCAENTMTSESVSVPALSVGTDRQREFMILVILLNHSQAGARYHIKHGP